MKCQRCIRCLGWHSHSSILQFQQISDNEIDDSQIIYLPMTTKLICVHESHRTEAVLTRRNKWLKVETRERSRSWELTRSDHSRWKLGCLLRKAGPSWLGQRDEVRTVMGADPEDYSLTRGLDFASPGRLSRAGKWGGSRW